MIRFKALLGFLLILLGGAIAILGVVSYRNNEDSITTARLVNQTYTAIQKADEILSEYKDLQHESNRILFTNDTSFVARYLVRKKRLFAHINDLRRSAKDNVIQQSTIDSLATAVVRWDNKNDSVLLADAGGPRGVHAWDQYYQNPWVDVILFKIQQLKNHEHVLLKKRQFENKTTVAAFQRTFIVLLVCIAVLLIVTFIAIRYNFNKRVRMQEELTRAEHDVKKALEAEIELNKLKSNFVTLASHEFRTPLTTILSSAILMDNYTYGADQEKARKHLARIKSSVKNLTSILDEFLSITKIEEGHVQPSFERLDLQVYLKEICDTLQAFAKPGQTIRYHHAGDTWVDVDPVLLRNILNNLVSNAIKYSPDNASIDISSVVDGKILLRVRDHGIGIPEDDQRHLFERFYRASNAGQVQGTGLGLHIMKHYVDMLNGEIRLESAPGEGTSVEVVLKRV